MPNKKNHWISLDDSGKWVDKREGGQRASGKYDRQNDAFEKARGTAKKEGGEVIIKNRQGKIRERNTYGKRDPYPPEG